MSIKKSINECTPSIGLSHDHSIYNGPFDTLMVEFAFLLKWWTEFLETVKCLNKKSTSQNFSHLEGSFDMDRISSAAI